MPQLLLEFFSEEIPARMQKRAEEDLARALGEKLKGAGLEAPAIKTFSTPRRIGAVIDDLPAKAADVNEEKKGPRVGAPEQAIQGFLKSAGLTSLDQALIVEDKKGAFYVARIERAGRETSAILQEIVPEIVRAFPWPKSMRSGSSDLTWVRPLQNILCIFAGAPVKIGVDGVASEAKTWGHRFHAPDAIRPKDFADYAAKLRAAKVLIDREARKAIILEQANAACAKRGMELVPDLGLLEEVAGLVEWPVVLLGDMDPDFLDLPGEVIRLSMRTHQKYFAVRDPKTQKLAPHFVVVANIEAKDGGKAIAAGNARVLSARLNDARFFWDSDRKTPLYTEERREKLEKIVFHQKLGSVWDKVERVKALAVELAPVVWRSLECRHSGASRSDEPGIQHASTPWIPDRASRVRNDELLASFIAAIERAADLCKMDLVTETVGEFPELQGQIGRQLYLAELSARLPLDGGGGREAARGGARAGAESTALRGHAGKAGGPHPLSHAARDSSPIEGERESVALAIEDHYRPLGPNDRVPSDPVAVTLALADKLDTLVGFWAIDEKPTGSSDAYALRRAALGLVRILVSNNIRVELFEDVVGGHWPGVVSRVAKSITEVKARVVIDPVRDSLPEIVKHAGAENIRGALAEQIDPASIRDAVLSNLRDLPAFLADRLKVQLREQGKRHDLVDAVFSLGDGDLVRIVARVEALDAFLKTEAGANLLAGYKRAANILSAEEKKGKWGAEEAQGAVDVSTLAEPAEKALHAALEAAIPKARAAVEQEDFAAAMSALAGLRAPVDAFFDQVLVNAPEEHLRRNRLLLLTRFREALSAVADFSKVEG
jgi:glycyl-tRNA synthetase beta chain